MGMKLVGVDLESWDGNCFLRGETLDEFGFTKLFDVELFDSPFHEKRLRWLADESVTTSMQLSIAGREPNRLRKIYIYFLIIIFSFVSGFFLYIKYTCQSESKKSVARKISITLTPLIERASFTGPKPPPSLAKSLTLEKIAESRVEDESIPITEIVRSTTNEKHPIKRRKLVLPPTSDVDYEPLHSSPGTALREGTTVFDPRFKKRLESAEVAEINTRRVTPSYESYTGPGGGEFVDFGNKCFSVFDDPSTGSEKWVSKSCPPHKQRFRRFGRTIETE